MTESVSIAALMAASGVGFGTSGARGLADAMTDRVCYAHVAAFLAHLRTCGEALPGTRVALAGDRRPSTPRILEACAAAIADAGCSPVNCGAIPTPAVASYGLREGIPSLMVTGSHIPDDRNGIKFYRAAGEILKDDEAGIRLQRVTLTDERFVAGGALRTYGALPPATDAAYQAYVRRYLDFFPDRCLAGRRVALYEHSTVSREPFAAVLRGLGADVIPLGRSTHFVPVDTEAIRPEDVALARQWAKTVGYDAIVSADGDGDRPLVGDEQGRWLRGDVAGIYAARYLDADAVVTPVSSNTALEKSGWFRTVVRTRIGSPYVIAAMQATSGRRVVGYEANGGFLSRQDIVRDGRTLPALPTRDAIIVALAVLGLAAQQGLAVSALAGLLPPRYTASDRLKDFPNALSNARLGALRDAGVGAIERTLGPDFGPVAAIDHTDGLRITFANGEIVHLRPSGNAPELRCYAEADTAERADAIARRCLEILDGWRS